CSSSTVPRAPRCGRQLCRPTRRMPSPASTMCSVVVAPVRSSIRWPEAWRKVELSADCRCGLRSQRGGRYPSTGLILSSLGNAASSRHGGDYPLATDLRKAAPPPRFSRRVGWLEEMHLDRASRLAQQAPEVLQEVLARLEGHHGLRLAAGAVLQRHWLHRAVRQHRRLEDACVESVDFATVAGAPFREHADRTAVLQALQHLVHDAVQRVVVATVVVDGAGL